MDKSTAQPKKGPIAIGLSIGRCGTLSMCEALKLLYCGQCYHWSRVPSTQEYLSLLSKATHGKDSHDDWRGYLDGFSAAVGSPVTGYWHILKDVYPDAKLFLLRRDGESWYKSFQETALAIFKYHHTPVYYLCYYTWPALYTKIPFLINVYHKLLGKDFMNLGKYELISRFEADCFH